MATLIRLIARVDGVKTRVDGGYLVEYDPTIRGDVYTLTTAPQKAGAKRFASFADAVACYRAICPNVPYDGPGHINRPLTAYTISFEASDD